MWGKNMNNKILIGSIFVLTLLLLMPSIPAIQQKTILNKAYNDLVEQLDIEDVKEIRKMDWIRHPLLYVLVIFIAKFRLVRCLIIGEDSCDFSEFPPWFEIYHPIRFFWCLWLIFTIAFWCSFWENISDTLRWNWNIKEIILR